MKVSELRIGNYVSNQTGELKDIPTGKPVQITAESFVWADLYVPIPLTERWIENLGFDQLGDFSIYNIEDYQIEKRIDGFYFFIDNFTKNPPSRKIEFVHQLQNLYFALTGQELTVK